jgi:hypothetical protein
MTIYPEFPYPKAATNHNDKDWLVIDVYDAFNFVLNGDWRYSDFHRWLETRDRNHYKLGYDDVINSMKLMYQINNITI